MWSRGKGSTKSRNYVDLRDVWHAQFEQPVRDEEREMSLRTQEYRKRARSGDCALGARSEMPSSWSLHRLPTSTERKTELAVA